MKAAPPIDAEMLLAWYDRHARDLPWRIGPGKRAQRVAPDPYRVWLSEVMLQQTTVATVKAYFERFVALWPSIADLAAAPLEAVLVEWAGLGYYARARNLHTCARAVVERHGGVFPGTSAELQTLPGVGPYTAAAVAAIAFDERVAVVDGNVERVMARFLALDRPPREAKDDIRAKLERAVPARAGDFAQAMMDLGAGICTPKRPSCLVCPVQQDCAASAHGIAERLPMPERWTTELAWVWLRRFHRPGAAVLAATPTLASELTARGFHDVKLWSRGVDANLFRPRAGAALDLPRPIFLTVGRVAVEKNLEAFLKLDLPGTKLVVGDGPARDHLTKKYPGAVFVGAKHGAELADIYAAADVFVFPSRTDTFGLVLLEALASGVPVAAFPAAAPRDVIGSAPVGCLDEDLKAACLTALALDRAACRDFARGLTWEATARTFVKHVTEATQKPRRRRDRDRAAA